jgi:hypothetical protein
MMELRQTFQSMPGLHLMMGRREVEDEQQEVRELFRVIYGIGM